MDSRINFITNLKDCLTSRNSQVHQTIPETSEELPSQQDIEYVIIKKQIVNSQFFMRATKHLRIRLQKWLQYLDKIKSNKVWIKSRNKYIKLLNLMCYCECLIEPFNILPPEGELPTIRKHEVNQIIDEVQNYIKNNAPNSRKMSQVSQITTREEELDSFFSRKTQSSKHGQNYASNIFEIEQESETVPLKNVNMNVPGKKNSFQTEEDEKTVVGRKKRIYLKSSKQNVKDETGQKLKSREPICSKDLSSDKNKSKTMGKQQDRSSSMDEAKGQMKFDKTLKQNEIQIKKSPVSPLPPKCKTIKDCEKLKLKDLQIDTMQKEYWQSLSNSEVHTPKYLNNYTSQHAIIQEQCVEVMSFREADSCDCSMQLFGEGWFSNIFKKITS